MALPYVFPDAFLQFTDRPGLHHLAPEHRAVDIERCVTSGSPDDNGVPFFVPLQQGPGPDSELPTHRHRH